MVNHVRSLPLESLLHSPEAGVPISPSLGYNFENKRLSPWVVGFKVNLNTKSMPTKEKDRDGEERRGEKKENFSLQKQW